MCDRTLRLSLWLRRLAARDQVPADHPSIIHALSQSVQYVVGGSWNMVEDRSLLPSFRQQLYGNVVLTGTDVRQDGDTFQTKIFYQIYKFPNRENSKKSYEKLTHYHPVQGHELLNFYGILRGWKPGMKEEKLFPVGDDGFTNLKTPFQVAKWIDNEIDDFYRRSSGDDSGGGDSYPFSPVPSDSRLVMV